MLILQFQVGADRFAVDSRRVIEVIPCVALRPVPRAPHYLKGMFHYRGQVVSVIDLAELMGGSACQVRLSTRLIVVKQANEPGRSGDRLIALLAENVNDLVKVRDDAWAAPSVTLPQSPYLGPVMKDDAGLIQLLDVDRIVPAEMQQALVTEAG